MTTQAIRTGDFINSIGVNTHIDFASTAYGNLQTVENSLTYIGVKNVRDSINTNTDIGTNGLWQQVANATGIKFDAFIGENSVAGMRTGLGYIQQVASQHILNSIEGGNEEDDVYPTSLGNTLAATAQFQQQVFSVGQSLGISVINMSFGSGWSNNLTSGDYGTVGNISAYSNYANAHTYFGTGNTPSYNIGWVNGLAQISSNHPVITTEMGWYTTGVVSDPTTVSETVQAKYMLDGLLDAYKAGDVKTYLYELLDQKTGDGYSEHNFGLFHSNGTAKLAATALHNMTTLLSDTGTGSASFTPGTLSYNLSGTTSSDNSLLMEKSNGTYWLSIWNESRLSSATSSKDIAVPNHTVTLTLGSNASSIIVFDPLTGTSAVQTLSNTGTAQISLPDHPVLVEIITSNSAPVTTPASLSSNDLSITTPTSLSTTVGGAVQIAASISDAWAAASSGNLTLNVSATAGTLAMTANGQAVAGSGTNAIHLSGTLAQLNAELATLTFHAPTTGGTDTVSINAWNQAGVSATQSTAVGVISGSNDLSVTVPGSLSTAANSSVHVAASINDVWATYTTGAMALNVITTGGTVTMTDASGHAVNGSGTGAIHLTGTLAQLNADLATLNFHSPGTVGTDIVSVNVWNQAGIQTTQSTAIGVTPGSNSLAIDPPTNIGMIAGQTVQVSGVSIIDAWAANHAGLMTLNVTTAGGGLAMTDASGNAVIGSGTSAIHVNGTLSQINADLATLSYHASNGVGTDILSVNIWNQAGVNATQTIAVNNLLAGSVTGTAGSDILSSSAGQSVTGNGGDDVYYFTTSNTGSGITANHIADFNQSASDKIDLHGFGLTSANFNSTGTLSGSKSFTFEQLTDTNNHPYTQVNIETNGSHTPQYQIHLDNAHVNLHASDFIFV